MFHINAMSLIYKNIEKAENDKDEKAVEKIGYAQYLSLIHIWYCYAAIVDSDDDMLLEPTYITYEKLKERCV